MGVCEDIVELSCAVQNYEWGQLGNESKVAVFAFLSSNIPIDPSKPYAELWMGTHPNAPSLLKGQSISLKEYIGKNPSKHLGKGVAEAFDGDVPFLFKVLSIRKALSIQAHPDKVLAAKLFKDHPQIYKDPNHKPEMAIALTDFEALSGFQPLESIKSNLYNYPEFKAVAGGDEAVKKFQMLRQLRGKEGLRKIFTNVMTCDSATVQAQLTLLVKRLKSSENLNLIDSLILRLHDSYPGDVGVFCVLLLNYMRLKPFACFFMGPNEPHAYLSGSCIEVMATSDNVVRAGLTPKYKDVETLTSMLTYNFVEQEDLLLKPQKKSESTLLFQPPVAEFACLFTKLSSATAVKSESFGPIDGPTILICTNGVGSLKYSNDSFSLQPGSVYFISADTEYSLVVAESSEDLIVFAAFCVDEPTTL